MFDGASVDGIEREIETEINRRVPLTRDRDLNPFKKYVAHSNITCHDWI